jgi:hypothetical protein
MSGSNMNTDTSIISGTNATGDGRVLATLKRIHQCASQKADTMSIPHALGKLNSNMDNFYTQAILGNSVSGAVTTLLDAADGKWGDVMIDVLVGGTRQGLPGGGFFAQGAAGIILTAGTRAVVDDAELASGILAVKLTWDSLTYANGVYKCY